MKLISKVQLEVKDINQTYSGQEGCACGCNGKYASTYEVATARRIKRINDNIDKVKVYSGAGEYIFELITKQGNLETYGRVIRAYVSSKHLSPEALILIKQMVEVKELKKEFDPLFSW